MHNFWNSRIRLTYILCLLLLLKISLNRLRIHLSERGQYQREDGNDDGGIVGGSFTDDVDYALGAMQYMYDLRLGKAEIRPVIDEVLFQA